MLQMKSEHQSKSLQYLLLMPKQNQRMVGYPPTKLIDEVFDLTFRVVDSNCEQYLPETNKRKID